MLLANRLGIVRVLLTIFITSIVVVVSIYIAWMLGFTYPRTIHRVSVSTPISPPEATPIIVLVFSLISIPLSYLLFKNMQQYNIVLYLTIMLALISLLNLFFEYFLPSILLISILILSVLHKIDSNNEGILMTFAFFSITTIALYVLLMMKVSYADIFVHLSELDMSFWSLIRSITPIIYLVILLSPLWRIVSTSLLKSQEKHQNIGKIRRDIKIELIAVVIGILLSLIFYVLPYTSILNPHKAIATTDIVIYVARLNEMEIQNPIEVAFRYPDRPLYLLLLYGLKRLFNCDNIAIATISGWIWSALLVIAVWFLSRELFDREVALISVILTPLSHQMMSFIYGGFHANQFTLSLLYVAIALINKIDLKRLILSILILSIASLCHTWSWVHITSAILLYMLVRIIKCRKNRKLLKYYTSLLITLISIIVIGEVFIHNLSYTSRFVLTNIKNLNYLMKSMLSNNKLFDAFAYYLWGSLNIPLLYLLALLATFKRRNNFTLLDTLYLSTFGYTMIYLDSIDIVSRLCINVPIQIEVARIRALRDYVTLVMIVMILLGNCVYLIYNAVPVPP